MRKTPKQKVADLRLRVAALMRENERLQSRVDAFESDARWRQREKEMAYAAFDRCNDEVTRHELELFEASPAYQKYQRWRHGKEMRGTDDWRLKTGDWRAP